MLLEKYYLIHIKPKDKSFEQHGPMNSDEWIDAAQHLASNLDSGEYIITFEIDSDGMFVSGFSDEFYEEHR